MQLPNYNVDWKFWSTKVPGTGSALTHSPLTRPCLLACAQERVDATPASRLSDAKSECSTNARFEKELGALYATGHEAVQQAKENFAAHAPFIGYGTEE